MYLNLVISANTFLFSSVKLKHKMYLNNGGYPAFVYEDYVKLKHKMYLNIEFNSNSHATDRG